MLFMLCRKHEQNEKKKCRSKTESKYKINMEFFLI